MRPAGAGGGHGRINANTLTLSFHCVFSLFPQGGRGEGAARVSFIRALTPSWGSTLMT